MIIKTIAILLFIEGLLSVNGRESKINELNDFIFTIDMY